MAAYITIDGGTTNTRIYLYCKEKIVYSLKIPFGARDGKEKLKPALAEAIKEILDKNSLSESDIKAIIASGMITSDLGLCALTHISAPAGLRELKAAVHTELFPDVSDIPITFVRGVKCGQDSADTADMMRGEETELMGLINHGEALYILPGSHSKHISVDELGRITEFRTMLSGELLYALATATILKNSVDLSNCELDTDELIHGFELCERVGINEALFKTRILGNLFGTSPSKCYSFLLGAVLKDEVLSAIKAREKRIVIGGQRQMRYALAHLLRARSEKEIEVLEDSLVESSTVLGAVRVLEYND